MAVEVVAGSFELRGLTERLRRLEGLLTASTGDPLQALVVAAQDGIPGASAVSITTLRRGEFVTEAASSQRALDADQLQYTLGSGPCVDAVLGDQIYHPSDLAHDPRWPQLGHRVSTEIGFNSCLSYRLAPDVIVNAATPPTAHTAQPSEPRTSPGTTPRINAQPRPSTTGSSLVGHRSSLNVYGDAAGAFGQDSLVAGLLFATYAVSLITTIHALDSVHHLEQALVNSRQIGVAVGILMNAHKLTQDAAFTMLRTASQNSNRKISDLADELVDTGALPDHTRRDRTRGR